MAAQLQPQTQQFDYRAIRQKGIQAIMANPGMTQTRFNSEFKRLNELIETKQREEGVRSGLLDISDLAVTDIATANRLFNEGFRPSTSGGAGTATIRTKREARGLLRKSAKNALNEFQKFVGNKQDVTGGFTNLFRRAPLSFLPDFLARENTGNVTSESTKARGLIADVAAKFAFGEGGKAFTETEKEIVRGLMPAEEEDEGVIIDKLKQLIDILDRELGVSNSQTSTGSGLSQEDEALIQKFKR